MGPSYTLFGRGSNILRCPLPDIAMPLSARASAGIMRNGCQPWICLSLLRQEIHWNLLPGPCKYVKWKRILKKHAKSCPKGHHFAACWCTKIQNDSNFLPIYCIWLRIWNISQFILLRGTREFTEFRSWVSRNTCI